MLYSYEVVADDCAIRKSVTDSMVEIMSERTSSVSMLSTSEDTFCCTCEPTPMMVTHGSG